MNSFYKKLIVVSILGVFIGNPVLGIVPITMHDQEYKEIKEEISAEIDSYSFSNQDLGLLLKKCQENKNLRRGALNCNLIAGSIDKILLKKSQKTSQLLYETGAAAALGICYGLGLVWGKPFALSGSIIAGIWIAHSRSEYISPNTAKKLEEIQNNIKNAPCL